MSKRRGLFISFEGPEGSGKTTHSRKLCSWLSRQGVCVVRTWEPGGTHLGGRVRGILLSKVFGDLDPFVELCLYEASRAILVDLVILPDLEKGKIVVVDRFQDSTWVYQGWAGGFDLKLIEKMGRIATKGVKPDLTILLDIPAKKGLSRVRRPNRIEAKAVSFHRKVRNGYLHLARKEQGRFRIINAARPFERVRDEIRLTVKEFLGRKGYVLRQHRRK